MKKFQINISNLDSRPQRNKTQMRIPNNIKSKFPQLWLNPNFTNLDYRQKLFDAMHI